MARELKYMFEQKVSAVRVSNLIPYTQKQQFYFTFLRQRIMESAQNTALTHERTEVIQNYSYYNSKEMLTPNETAPANQTNYSLDDRSLKLEYIPPARITLTKNKRFFDTPVNTSMSSVHIPTNVFDRGNLFPCDSVETNSIRTTECYFQTTQHYGQYNGQRN